MGGAASPSAAAKAPAVAQSANANADGTISIDDFKKVDLRIARIANAEHVEGAEKLLKLTLDLGTETRTVFSGIKAAYDPEKLKGRPHRRRLQPRASQDEVRPVAGNGAGGERRSGPGRVSARARLRGAPRHESDVTERSAEAIDALLPQTQCARCGYQGCKPYAEAIANGEAQINQCPPGGSSPLSARDAART